MEESYPIIDLTLLLQGNEETLAIFQSELQKKGWCFLNLPAELVEKASKMISQMKEFLQNKSQEAKNDFHYPPRYGYIKTHFKEALRFLTGEFINEMQLPSEFQDETLKETCQDFDKIAKQIASNSQNIFGASLTELAEVYNIPLFQQGSSRTGFGMLDMVEYDSSSKTEGDLVESHVDPGLFSINVKNSCEGLELLDKSSNGQ